VKSEGQGILTNGQKVIAREVEPAAGIATSKVKSVTTQKRARSRLPTSERIAQPKSLSEREYQTTMLSATVYDRSVTRLSWQHGETKYLAYTNADFN
jgi:hypothetical protein